MDPRWDTSGSRVEFTIDVSFQSTIANATEQAKIVKDNFGGKSSPVQQIICLSSKGAMLRRGFDSMKCHSGGYRLDYEK